VLAFGELLSTTVIAARAAASGIHVELLDSRDFILTDDGFNNASPDFQLTNESVQEHVRPQEGILIVTQGFIGRAPNGATTTLGRGGSDYTATIIGAALGASEVQIWTDVNGIMTSDPRVVPDARTVSQISYDEAAELAYFGAKVVHPSTIQPAIEHNIPVLVKNASDPYGPYTAIIDATYETGIRAIAGKRNVILINITSSRMLNAYGFLSRIFAVFERHRTPVDLIATSEVSVSVTIDSPTSLDAIVRDLKEVGIVGVERGKGIVCLVGKDLWKDSSFIASVFGILRGTPIRMISLGSSDINLSIVVPDTELSDVIKALHANFFSAG
jgi:aspartate kinase